MKTTETQNVSPGKSGIGMFVRQPPLRWKTILAPTDLSICSNEAIKTAVSLAKQHGAKMILFHVVPLPVCCSFDAPPDADEMIASANESLDKIADGFPPEVNCEKIVRLGLREPVREILEEAGNSCADLIVIGTHGYSGLKRVLLGSTSERIVRHASCPVLVVRSFPEESLQGDGK